MIPLPDVQLLVYAHREDSPWHAVALPWLHGLLDSGGQFAMCHEVLNSFVRIVTHPKIYDPPSTLDEAFEFVRQLREHPRCVLLRAGPAHWQILERLCRASNVTGGRISDAWLAALAMEHGCEFQTCDAAFGEFNGLAWRNPLGNALPL